MAHHAIHVQLCGPGVGLLFIMYCLGMVFQDSSRHIAFVRFATCHSTNGYNKEDHSCLANISVARAGKAFIDARLSSSLLQVSLETISAGSCWSEQCELKGGFEQLKPAKELIIEDKGGYAFVANLVRCSLKRR